MYQAQQTQPIRRDVALKIIKPGMDSRQVISRFEGERQALAVMDHPNIARVFDAGTTGAGLPYFAMELVDGVPITRYCDVKRLTVKERLLLFVPVCQAIPSTRTRRDPFIAIWGSRTVVKSRVAHVRHRQLAAVQLREPARVESGGSTEVRGGGAFAAERLLGDGGTAVEDLCIGSRLSGARPAMQSSGCIAIRPSPRRPRNGPANSQPICAPSRKARLRVNDQWHNQVSAEAFNRGDERLCGAGLGGGTDPGWEVPAGRVDLSGLSGGAHGDRL